MRRRGGQRNRHPFCFDPFPSGQRDQHRPFGCVQFTNADNTTDKVCITNDNDDALQADLLKNWLDLLGLAEDPTPKSNASKPQFETPLVPTKIRGALQGWNCLSSAGRDEDYFTCFFPHDKKATGCLDYSSDRGSSDAICFGELATGLTEYWSTWIRKVRESAAEESPASDKE